jgi:hemolysin activation/secretion protein
MRGIGRRLCQTAGFFVLLIPCASYAAPPAPVLPGNADPGRILQDLQSPPEFRPVTPDIITALLSGIPATTNGESVTFPVKSIQIEDITAYDPQIFVPLYHSYVGNNMSLLQLNEIVNAITKRYHDDGYALSTAILPPQDITDGTIRIQVIEGGIDNIEIHGTYRDSPVAQDIIERIWQYHPLNMKDLELDMLLLNDLPGISVQAVFKPPAESADGGTGLLLVFNDVPFANSVSVDNEGSRYVGPYQFGFNTGINHLIMPYQQTSLNGLVTSPLNNLQYFSASQRMPLDGNGTTLTL